MRPRIEELDRLRGRRCGSQVSWKLREILMCLTIPRLFKIAHFQELTRDTCVARIWSRPSVDLCERQPAGRLFTGRPVQFCDPGHKTTCLGSLRVPKNEKVQDCGGGS